MIVLLMFFSPLPQGLSFLDLRYHLLLFYLQDLTHLISVKTEGGKIKESGALDRLVTIRTVRFSAYFISLSYYRLTRETFHFISIAAVMVRL